MIRFFSDWQQRRQHRATASKLAALNSKLLRDVGVRCDDIETLRRGHNPWLD